MKELPNAEVYEQEFRFMPCGVLTDRVLDIVAKDTLRNGKVLDLMCGPGYLLGKIFDRRPDLILEGIDINDGFIQYAQSKYHNISFEVVDVLLWRSKKKYDLILCTAGVHHLPYDKQSGFLEKISLSLNKDGFAILADPFVDDFVNEIERKKAAAKLGYEYIIATIEKGAPDDIVKATIDVLYNDVMGFEYKTSLNKLKPVLERLFSSVEVTKTWPESSSQYGDYYIICRN